MEITIRLANKYEASDCLSCVRHSDLWDAYFESDEKAESEIRTMIAAKQIHIATNDDRQCVGFMGIVHKGCFRKFSYLSLLAVKSEFRGCGVGGILVRKFEQIGFKQADRVFLLVSDFNERAQRFYRRLGYKKAGKISDLFKQGVAEYLLVKYQP